MKSAGVLPPVPCCMSHPVRGAWVEMPSIIVLPIFVLSHPVRGAWVEIFLGGLLRRNVFVAPREGCVG